MYIWFSYNKDYIIFASDSDESSEIVASSGSQLTYLTISCLYK